MAVLAAFSIAPGGGAGVAEDGSVGAAVAEVIRLVRASGLPNETNAMFTNVEGSLDEVMALIKACTEHMAAVAPRVSVVIKLDVRAGHPGALTEKVATVERYLAGD
jgi:uncharacterized protein (TIGR00106 family)